MARKSPLTSDADPWQAFSNRHEGLPFLDKNPLYALPKDLINIIAQQIREVWTSTEVAFERDLAETATGGFFRKRRFHCPFLPIPKSMREERFDRDLEDLRKDLMRKEGFSDIQIRSHLQTEQKQNKDMALRELAYTAWLITNRQFLDEKDSYRRSWEDRVAATGQFPSYPRSFLGRPLRSNEKNESDFFYCYRRWEIDTFLTWDVPVPMSPQFHQVIYHDTVSLDGAGLYLFLPWYLLKDGRFTLQELAKQLRREVSPSHLDAWFSLTAGRRMKLGYKRLKNFFILYWCYRLALQDRYADQLSGRIKQLDRAFAHYLDLGGDSVKKLRLSMSNPE